MCPACDYGATENVMVDSLCIDSIVDEEMDHSFVLRPRVPGAQGRLQAMRGSDPPSPPVAKEALDVPLGHGCCGPGLWELWKTAAFVDGLPLPKMFLSDCSLWDKLFKKGSVGWGRLGAPPQRGFSAACNYGPCRQQQWVPCGV